MDREDPVTQFFPGQESVDLYAVLDLKEDATTDDIKKAYRRLALRHHPDKHATSDEAAKVCASLKFQQIGFAYAVLSDEKRRQRYDKTGRTDEALELGAGEDGWDTYFEELFDRVTKGKLDEMKREYQGSSEEIDDIKSTYMETNGSIAEIMTYIPHSTNDDEPRFIVLITELIAKGDLPSLPSWQESIHDEKARLVRSKQAAKEATEAEELAKELGVWDEFYGSGKAGSRKGKGKAKAQGKGKAKEEEQEAEDAEDYSALQALILKKGKKMDTFFDSLAAKYAEPEVKSKGKGKKRAKPAEDVGDAPAKKKSKTGPEAPPDIDDEEFEKLQQKLFGQPA
ncbi:hypothetical protein JAAARDRAFT_91527, partial [Jaapia argillacea MUCL 33604]